VSTGREAFVLVASYQIRELLQDEAFARKIDGTMTRVLDSKHRSFLDIGVDVGLRGFASVRPRFRRGSLPPAYSFVDNEFSISFEFKGTVPRSVCDRRPPTDISFLKRQSGNRASLIPIYGGRIRKRFYPKRLLETLFQLLLECLPGVLHKKLKPRWAPVGSDGADRRDARGQPRDERLAIDVPSVVCGRLHRPEVRVVLRQYSERPRLTYADVVTADHTQAAGVRMTFVPIAIGDANGLTLVAVAFARSSGTDRPSPRPPDVHANNPVLGGARLLRMPVRPRR
jgi:hypothetical protein